MLKFLTQPEIEAVLLTALLGIIGWVFIVFWKSRRGHKQFVKSYKFSPRHQLPSPPVNFTGRSEELAELEKELTATHKFGATISGKQAELQGMGGVGKTALATVLAHKLKHRYPDAQLYLNLRGSDAEHRSPVAPAEVMQNIIRALHPEAKLPEELDKLMPIYQGIMNAAGRVILFLDNAADAEQVKPLLPPANCLLLVTSRSHFSLPGLIQRNIDCLHPEKSQELLLKLAPRIKGDVKEAAELCGHLPLALEVFAGVVNDTKLYPVPDLLKRLSDGREKLTPVNAAFQVSYDLLVDDLRRCWLLLAVFPASFDLAAAVAVLAKNMAVSPLPAAGDTQADERRARSYAPYQQMLDSNHKAMQTLVNASLVEWNEANGRFRLHDLVCQFCNGKINEVERTAAKLRYAKHYRDIAIEAENLYLKGDNNLLQGLQLIDRERKHIVAMFEWLQFNQDKESANLLASLLDIMDNTGSLRFHPFQRIKWLERQILASRLINDRKAECRAIGYLGVAYYDIRKTRKAIELYNQALAISREIGYLHGESGALGNLGEAHYALGERDEAIKYLEASLVIDRETGNRQGESASLNLFGRLYADMGDNRRAVEAFEQALSICRELGNKRTESAALANLGECYSILDDVHKGIECIKQSLLLNREIGDQFGEGMILHLLANAFEQLGDSYKAIGYYEQALQSLREVGDLRGEGWVLGSYAVFLWNDQGDHTKAITLAEQSLKILESIEDSKANIVRNNLAGWRGQPKTYSVEQENPPPSA
jgi:tetratricopeptide (TPR) repeat protein